MPPARDMPLPHLTTDAVFVPGHALAARPHVAVDCAPVAGTVLALSHWPRAGTPAELADDTSALIADRYLRSGAARNGAPVGIVTCDHYDEDGLMALWLLLERPGPDALARGLAIAAAEAGDFGTWSDPAAAQVAIAAMHMAERGTTPFPDVNRVLARAGGRDPAGDLYLCLLPRVARLLDDPERFAGLWRGDWERIVADIALLDSGEALIEEIPEADLAIVRAPRPLHEMALHPRTRRMRTLLVTPDRTLLLKHRYETWVQYVSRPLSPRVDLAPLAARLQGIETAEGRWVAQDMEVIRPMVFLSGAGGGPAPSGIAPERFVRELAEVLCEATFSGAPGPAGR